MPVIEMPEDTTVARPELRLYQSQIDLLRGQKKLIDARNKPKLSAFLQPGYGRPGLNLFSTEFDAFYTTGIRLNWSLSGLYNFKRDKQLLDVSQRSINLQKETFVLNTQSQLSQQSADIQKFGELITADERIIEVRHQITEAAKAQLENAVITANDYLREVSGEDQARQNLIIHRLQLLQAKATYAITAGKL
jgi:outer membrane protein TolC